MADLPALDLGAASGGARQYDPNVAANPDYNSSYTSAQSAAAAVNQSLQTGVMANYRLWLAGTNYVAGDDTMPGSQATAEFGIKGDTPATSLSWAPDQVVSREQAYLAHEMTMTRAQDEWIRSRRPQTWTGFTSDTAGDFLGSAIDPVNIAAMFFDVPFLGRLGAGALGAARMTTAASAVTRMTQAMEANAIGRIGLAGLNNAGAVALTQPIIMAGAQADHYDYSFADAAHNVLFGGLVGGAFHGLGEALGGIRDLAAARAGEQAADAEAPTFDLGQQSPEMVPTTSPNAGVPIDGTTARGMMRGAVASMDSTHAFSPEASADMLAASRPQVIQDLSQTLGREPTEDEIAATVAQRSKVFMDNAAAGKYGPNIHSLEPLDASPATPDAIQEAVDRGDYETAAKLEQDHVAALENDPAFRVADADRAAVDESTSKLDNIKRALGDFTACVTGDIS